MNPPDLSQPLLTMARKDLKAAKVLALSDEPDVEIVGFHLQQATEKSLKAWLTTLNQPILKTHDLSYLLHQLESLGKNIDNLWSLAELNPFAVQFRYGLFDDEPFDWQEAYTEVESLMNHVAKEIS
ncbi:MAG: HEPN domain-containing protein [Ghiorsea sp.]|nr:HEPN domain-containing protein [Ghiorsea sp.]